MCVYVIAPITLYLRVWSYVYTFSCECVLLLVLHIIIDVHVLSVTKRCSIFLERVEKSKELSVSALWRSFFNASKSRKRTRTAADSDSDYIPSTSTNSDSEPQKKRAISTDTSGGKCDVYLPAFVV